MNQKNPNQNQYGNYGYTVPQGQYPYYPNVHQGTPQQAGQQQAPFQQYPTQPQQYQGGPFESSGSLLIPVAGQQAPTSSSTNPPASSGSVNYIEEILKLNKGKLAKVFLTFDKNPEWNAKVIQGIIVSAGRDHVILKDPQTGTHYLVLNVYIDYIEFEEPLEFEYPQYFR